jgi:membrane-associated phospholipid phosphatase
VQLFCLSQLTLAPVPSLHAATATCLSFFVARYGGTWGLVFALVYCSGMFWSTQYEHHHYAIDLVAGT